MVGGAVEKKPAKECAVRIRWKTVIRIKGARVVQRSLEKVGVTVDRQSNAPKKEA